MTQVSKQGKFSVVVIIHTFFMHVMINNGNNQFLHTIFFLPDPHYTNIFSSTGWNLGVPNVTRSMPTERYIPQEVICFCNNFLLACCFWTIGAIYGLPLPVFPIPCAFSQAFSHVTNFSPIFTQNCIPNFGLFTHHPFSLINGQKLSVHIL